MIIITGNWVYIILYLRGENVGRNNFKSVRVLSNGLGTTKYLLSLTDIFC